VLAANRLIEALSSHTSLLSSTLLLSHAGAPLDFSIPSFSLPNLFGGEPAAVVKKEAAKEAEGPSPLLITLAILLAPLALVQAVQLQTVARLLGQLLGGAEEPTPAAKKK